MGIGKYKRFGSVVSRDAFWQGQILRAGVFLARREKKTVEKIHLSVASMRII